jgi:hypothetical protein
MTERALTPAQAFAQSAVPKRSEDEWAELIRGDLSHALEGIIAAGAHLEQAKYQLGHGRFLPLLQSLGMHERTAERLMKIANNVVLANPTHGSKLPMSMRTLYELATLPPRLLEARIIDGTITPEIERKDVERLKSESKGKSTLAVDGKIVERRLPSVAKTKLTGTNGSLFDLKTDSVADIAAVIAANISDSKATALAKAILEALKRRKRERQRPAG